MNALIKIIILGWIGFLPMTALAQSSGGGGSASGAREFFLSGGFVGLNSSASEYDLAPGLAFIPFQRFSWMQATAEISYQKTSYRAGTTSNMVFLGGPTVNFGPFLSDSVFISIGFAYRSGASDYVDGAMLNPNGVGFYFLAGKRFPISSSFSVRPSLGVIACGTTGMIFRPLAVSYHF